MTRLKNVALVVVLLLVFVLTPLFAVVPLAEGFEGNTFAPQGWAHSSVSSTANWTHGTSTAGNIGPRSGSNFARINAPTSGAANVDWLKTTQLQISAGHNVFAFWAKNGGTNAANVFNVKLSTTTQANASFTVTLDTNITPGSSYTQYSYDLSAYNGTSVYLAIQDVSGVDAASTLCIDDVTGCNYALPPDAAVYISPINLAANTSTTINLTWSGASTGNPATSYEVWFGLDGAMTLQTTQASTSWTTPTLLYETLYNWRIVPIGEYGTTPTPLCAIYQFTTATEENVVYPPIYDFPGNTSTGVSINADLAWHDGIGEIPVEYDIYFGKVGSMIWVGNQVNTIQDFDPGTLDYYTWYYWQIIPTFTSGGLASGPIWSFRTEASTLPVELSSFTATQVINNVMRLNWTTQSETGVMGFFIYRGTSNDLSATQVISPLIAATNTSLETNYSYLDTELTDSGTYYYWLMNQDIDGATEFHGPVNVDFAVGNDNPTPVIPTLTGLDKIFPNPFNPPTTVSFSLAKAENVSITIFNIKGQLVRTMLSESKQAGSYRLQWNGKDNQGQILPSGVYYVKMTAGKYNSTQKALIMK